MSNFNYFGISNFKAFRTITEFELKPVTFLIGKNSSGKSSLTKAIRLCKGLSILDNTFPSNLNLGSPTDFVNNKSDSDLIEFNLPFNIIGLNRQSILTIKIYTKDNPNLVINELNIKDKVTNNVFYSCKYKINGLGGNEYFTNIDYSALFQYFAEMNKSLIETYLLYLDICKLLDIQSIMPERKNLEVYKKFGEIQDHYINFIKSNEKSNLFPLLNGNKPIPRPFLYFSPKVELITDESQILLNIVETKKISLNNNDEFTVWDDTENYKLLKEIIALSKFSTLFGYNFLNDKSFDYYKDKIETIISWEKENFNLLTNCTTELVQYNYFTNLRCKITTDKNKYEKAEEINKSLKDLSKLIDCDVTINDIQFDGSYFQFFINNFMGNVIENSYQQVKKMIKKIDYLPSIRQSGNRYFESGEIGKTYIDRLVNTFNNYNKDKHLLEWLKKFEIADDFNIVDVQALGIKVLQLIKNGFTVNIADVGFGHMQILPLILKCIIEKPALLIVEEPEANLHPALQSKLAELFVFCFKTYGTQFIIETHSEYIIRKMQSILAKKEIESNNVVIYYFNPEDSNKNNKKEDENENIVTTIYIEENGILTKSFGKGFYDEADKLSLELLVINNEQHN